LISSVPGVPAAGADPRRNLSRRPGFVKIPRSSYGSDSGSEPALQSSENLHSVSRASMLLRSDNRGPSAPLAAERVDETAYKRGNPKPPRDLWWHEQPQPPCREHRDHEFGEIIIAIHQPAQDDVQKSSRPLFSELVGGWADALPSTVRPRLKCVRSKQLPDHRRCPPRVFLIAFQISATLKKQAIARQ
jgi:hypothetical protein